MAAVNYAAGAADALRAVHKISLLEYDDFINHILHLSSEDYEVQP